MPGVALALAVDGEIVRAEAFGRANVETGLAAGPDTIFALASVSKIYTAAAALRLVDRGALDLSEPVVKWLPALRIPNADRIRLHHLLCHTSGLPPLPSRYHALDRNRPGEFLGGAMDVESERVAGPMSERAGFADCDGLIEYLNGIELRPLGEPGALHSYSNEGYALLGGVIEAASGRPYADLLDDTLFAPLGLRRSATGPAPAEALGDCAAAYHRIDGRPEPIEPWDAPVWFPAGGLRASAPDVVRFVSSLDPDAPLFPAHAHSLATDAGYGYGVGLNDADGIEIRRHDGGADGISAAFALVPARRAAVSVLCNLDRAGASELAWSAVNALVGRPLDAPSHALREIAAPADLAEYAGVFASPEGLRLEFEVGGSALAAKLGDAAAPCPFVGPDRVLLSGQPARFLRRAGNDEIWAIAVGHRIVPRAGRLTRRRAARESARAGFRPPRDSRRPPER